MPARTRTILIVEDDAWIRGVLRDVLTDANYLVVEAHDGRTGLRLIEEHAPDLVLLDIALPELTGLDVLRQMRRARRTREVPVVVLSAYPRVLSQEDMSSVTTVLSKPFELDRLVETLASILSASDAPCEAAGQAR